MKKVVIYTFYFSFLIFNSCGLGHPPFDSEKPDTGNNQFHFEHLINVKITPDVKNLYTYGNDIGIDASYYLAFECKKETSLLIINANDLIQDSEFGIPLMSGFEMDW